MKLVLSLLLTFIISPPMYAATKPAFLCKLNTPRAQFQITVNPAGEAELQLKKPGGQVQICSMVIKRFEDRRKAILPEFRLFFERGACSPALSSEFDELIRHEPKITLRMRRNRMPSGRLHLFELKPAENCLVNTFSEKDFALNGSHWGQHKTSDPN